MVPVVIIEPEATLEFFKVEELELSKVKVALEFAMAMRCVMVRIDVIETGPRCRPSAQEGSVLGSVKAMAEEFVPTLVLIWLTVCFF